MKKVFGSQYSSLYDSLYRDKNYSKEVNFIEKVFQKHFKKGNVSCVLDLGCGTGSHDLILSQRGYHVTGVDRSLEMISLAQKKTIGMKNSVRYIHSDITSLHLKKKYDAVISMFAVMGYQTDNESLKCACDTARRHLKPGGIFLFDCWNGVAVLQDPPHEKMKEVNTSGQTGNRVIRYTRPVLHGFDHMVEINFQVFVIKEGRIIRETRESHFMRFFFPKEIRYYLESAGFSEVYIYPFLEMEKPLISSDWNMMVVAKG